MFTEDFEKANQSMELFLKEINSFTRYGKEIISIENSSHPILRMFDKYSGIDAIQITKDNQIRTIAIRVQFGTAWDTFTIRYKRHNGAETEYKKRLDAIKNEKLYPNLTLQCYLSNDFKEILSCGIIQTKTLYKQIQERPEIKKIRSAKEDANIFLYVSFYDLDEVLIYKNKKINFYKLARNRDGP